MRDKNDLDAQKTPKKPTDKTAPATPVKKENTDIQGVFVVKTRRLSSMKL